MSSRVAVEAVPPDRDLAGEAIDLAAELLGVEGVEVLAGGADHRLLEVADQQVAVDVPVTGDGVEDAERFGVHGVSVEVAELLGCRDAGMNVMPV